MLSHSINYRRGLFLPEGLQLSMTRVRGLGKEPHIIDSPLLLIFKLLLLLTFGFLLPLSLLSRVPCSMLYIMYA